MAKITNVSYVTAGGNTYPSNPVVTQVRSRPRITPYYRRQPDACPRRTACCRCCFCLCCCGRRNAHP